MIRLLAVIDRDIKKLKRNPVVLGLSVLLPIIYLIILGNSFQGKLTSLPLMIVNNDTGTFSNDLIDNLQGIASGPKIIDIDFSVDQKAAIDAVKNGKYKAALIIPSDFSKNIIRKRLPEAALFLDNTDGISSETIKNTISGAIKGINVKYLSVRESNGNVYLRNKNLYKQIDYKQSLVPGVVIMAIFLGTLTTGAFNLVMDRFLGVDESYMLTPLSKFDIVAGLIISGLGITTIIAVIILIISMLLTGITLWDGLERIISLILLIMLTTLSLLSLMFVIMGRIGHPRVVGIMTGFLNVILFFPSGAVYPIASFPNWLKAFAKVNPEAYAVDAFKAVLFKGAGLAAISGDIIFLTCFTTLFMSAAIMSFKRGL